MTASAAFHRLVLALPLLLLPPLLHAADVVERREGNLVFQDVPATDPAVAERIDQYQETRSASLQGWLPDGSALISTRFADTSQIHRVAAPGGARRQLTFFDEPVGGAEPSPDPARPGFLYTRDVGGSEFYQVFFFDLATGTSTMLTDGESRNSSPTFSDDGRRVAFASTRRTGVDTDVWVGGLSPDDARVVTERGGSWFPLTFSPDGTKLLVTRYVSRSEAHPHVVDLATGAITPVLPEGLVARVGSVDFGPGGSLWLTSDLGGEFVRLYRLEGPGATPEPVSPELGWDVESFEFSPERTWLAWTANVETLSALYLENLETGESVTVPEMPDGIVYGLEFTPDGTTLGFTLNGPRSPGDVYALALDDQSLVRWTESEVGGLDAERFVAPAYERFPTFDTAGAGAPRTVPAFVYRPEGEGPHPVVVSIHGGPESQARPYFSSTYQFWVKELGFAVVVPNVRGSTGYGRSYHRLDNGFGREDSVRDIGALLDWIEDEGDLDAERVAVYGGSYGGYMVLASMTLFPERIAAGVEAVGISNFVTFLENTQDYRRDLRREEYGDERDPDMRAFLESISPLNRVDRIAAPLLVIQGANDPRVPASESEQIVAALRASGQEVWYLLALDEGHGFRKRSNRDASQVVTAQFLERQLAK